MDSPAVVDVWPAAIEESERDSRRRYSLYGKEFFCTGLLPVG